jgi:hypothetical protein
MTKPTRIEINCETLEETIVELTDAEIAEMEIRAEAAATEQAEREAAASFSRSKSISRSKVDSTRTNL